MTKGIGFHNIRAFALERFGEPGWEQVLGALALEDRRVVEGVVPVGWYSLDLYTRLIAVLNRLHGRGDFSLLDQLGHYEAQRDLTTVHRLFMRIANPGLILDRTMELWRRFHDTGRWTVVRGNKIATGTLEDWGVIDAGLCADLNAYIRGIIEVGAGKGVAVKHTHCRSSGHPTCIFVATWR